MNVAATSATLSPMSGRNTPHRSRNAHVTITPPVTWNDGIEMSPSRLPKVITWNVPFRSPEN